MTLKFGLQLYSVREALKKDNIGTFEKIAEIGYKNLQLTRVVSTNSGIEHVAGTLTAAELNDQMKRLGMNIVNMHAKIDENTDWDRLLAFNEEIGSSAILIPMGYFTDKSSTLDYAHELNKYGEICRKNGIDFYYHNHFHEFQVFEGETIMDLLLDNTDKDLVKFEFDTYWAVRGGVDPVEWLLKMGDRCDIIHQKDLPTTALPLNWFDFFGKDARITLHEMLQTQKPEHFAEIGEGIMDIKYLIEKMRQAGVKYIFVEQDMTLKDEIESITTSYKNIVELLK